MPSCLIQTSSVRSCSFPAPRSKSAIAQIAHANVPAAPTMVSTREKAPGRNSPRNAAAAGSQRGMERGRLTSRGLDQEVQDHRAGADDQQRRVGAQEAGLQGADGG